MALLGSFPRFPGSPKGLADEGSPDRLDLDPAPGAGGVKDGTGRHRSCPGLGRRDGEVWVCS